MSRSASYDGTGSTNGRTISLLDRSVPKARPSASPSLRELTTDTEQSDSDHHSTNTPSRTLSKKLTNHSLQHSVRQHINRQKYAKYQSYRYATQKGDQDAGELTEDNDTAKPRGILERGRAQGAKLLRGQKRLEKEDERDAVLDILYENQRGSFLFGVPRFSSKSLLQIDAKPWQNADFRTSAVDIRNAQVPDPSWMWAWNSWYVDMSRDVDEQGWEYSFAFGNKFAWHGNHPWLYSFVRRRRWLRRRVRKDKHHKTKERGHELAPDYFTIHTKVISTGSQLPGRSQHLHDLDDDKLEDTEIADIGSLLQHLRTARLDREKLIAIQAFMKSASADDIQYLSEQITDIMSSFIYQSSRRQLLAELLQQHKEISKRVEELAEHQHDDNSTQTKHDEEAKRADSILHAIHAADQEIQKLEYWSDIRDMARAGDTLSEQDVEEWKNKRWQGLTASSELESFSAKQDVDAPAAKLHDKPEQHSKHSKHSSDETDSSAYTTAPSVAPSLKSPNASDKRPSKPDGGKRPSVVVRQDSESGLERFVTASEGPVSSVVPKQLPKKSARNPGRKTPLKLDGVAEEDELDDDDHTDPSDSSDDGDEEEAKPPLHEVNAEDSSVD